MYDKSQFKDPTKPQQVAFRGSFLMSPRVPVFRKKDGSYVPGAQPPAPGPNGKPDRKHFVLFSRN